MQQFPPLQFCNMFKPSVLMQAHQAVPSKHQATAWQPFISWGVSAQTCSAFGTGPEVGMPKFASSCIQPIITWCQNAWITKRTPSCQYRHSLCIICKATLIPAIAKSQCFINFILSAIFSTVKPLIYCTKQALSTNRVLDECYLALHKLHFPPLYLSTCIQVSELTDIGVHVALTRGMPKKSTNS